MKAPEKIYLHKISAEELTENLPYHVCYIRKDALLEWARERLSLMKSYTPSDGARIYSNAVKDLIEKLNSM